MFQKWSFDTFVVAGFSPRRNARKTRTKTMQAAEPSENSLVWHPIFSTSPVTFSSEIPNNLFPEFGVVTKVLSSRSLQVSYSDGSMLACQYLHGAQPLELIQSMVEHTTGGVWLIGASTGIREERGRSFYFVRRITVFVNSEAYALERSASGVVHGDVALLAALSSDLAYFVEAPIAPSIT